MATPFVLRTLFTLFRPFFPLFFAFSLCLRFFTLRPRERKSEFTRGERKREKEKEREKKIEGAVSFGRDPYFVASLAQLFRENPKHVDRADTTAAFRSFVLPKQPSRGSQLSYYTGLPRAVAAVGCFAAACLPPGCLRGTKCHRRGASSALIGQEQVTYVKFDQVGARQYASPFHPDVAPLSLSRRLSSILPRERWAE